MVDVDIFRSNSSREMMERGNTIILKTNQCSVKSRV